MCCVQPVGLFDLVITRFDEFRSNTGLVFDVTKSNTSAKRMTITTGRCESYAFAISKNRLVVVQNGLRIIEQKLNQHSLGVPGVTRLQEHLTPDKSALKSRQWD